MQKQFKTYSTSTIQKGFLKEAAGLTGLGRGASEDCGTGDGGLVGSQRSVSVLVVDDEPLILDLLEAYFEEWPVRIQRASSCLEALDCLNAQRYDLVISDFFLREGDGVGLFATARLMNPLYCERFLFMSGSRNDLRVKRLTDRYGLPCLAKPFSFGELRAAVLPILSASLAALAPGCSAEERPLGMDAKKKVRRG